MQIDRLFTKGKTRSAVLHVLLISNSSMEAVIFLIHLVNLGVTVTVIWNETALFPALYQGIGALVKCEFRPESVYFPNTSHIASHVRITLTHF